MKFGCEMCHTKYSIADERVRGRVLKIRCKTCQHVMVVREEPMVAVPAQPSTPPIATTRSGIDQAIADSFGDPEAGVERTMISKAPAAMFAHESVRAKAPPKAGGHDGWFLAFDGEQEGPLSLPAARDRVTQESGREAYAWRAGFSSWLLAEEVPELQLLKRAPREPSGPVRPQKANNGAAKAKSPRQDETKPEKRHPQPAADAAAEHTDYAPRGDTRSDVSIPVPHHTGPAPLPSAELSEPVALQDLNQANPLGAPKREALDSFAGISNAVAKLSAEPVVVITGKRDDASQGRLKWLAGLLVALVLILLIWLVRVVGRTPAPVRELPPQARAADNQPIAINQPSRTIADTPLDPKAGKNSKMIKTPAKPTLPASRAPALQSTAPKPHLDDKSEHSVPTIAPRNTSVQMSQNAILEVVNRNKRSLNLCYQRVLKHDSSIKHGKLTTHLRIGISGTVSEVSIPDSDMTNSELGSCIKQAIRQWHFPAADSEYQTEFPIILQAQ